MRSLPLLLSAIAALGLAAGCKPAEATQTPTSDSAAAVNVRVAPVESSTATPIVRVAGILARQTEAALSFPLSGLLAEVTVRDGDQVQRDQVLARLQPDPIEAQLSQARAIAEKATRDLDRIEKLQADRAATLENLQDARSNVEQAEAGLRAAEFNRRHAVIVAPADGLILRRLAEPNEIIGAGRPVVTFASESDGWIVKAGLSSHDAARLQIGTSAELVDGNGGRARGKVVRIAGAADPATRSVPLEVQLDTPPPGARSGLIVALVLLPGPVPARTRIPLSALREGRGNSAFVFVVENGAKTARRLAVEIELIDGDHAYLRSNLPASQRVVVAGAQYLNDGSPVNLTN